MTFQHFNRRTHLYLALFLLPWFLLYGVSSIPFSHNRYFEERDKAKNLPLWTVRWEKPYDIEAPQNGPFREFARRIVTDHRIPVGSYGAYRQNANEIHVFVYKPLHSMRIKYFIKEKKLVAEDRRFRWDHFLTGLHAKGGFDQDDIWQDLWAVVVDVVCLGMLMWIVTGFIMWWKLPSTRGWGWLALMSGIISFTLFLIRL